MEHYKLKHIPCTKLPSVKPLSVFLLTLPPACISPSVPPPPSLWLVRSYKCSTPGGIHLSVCVCNDHKQVVFVCYI